MQDSLYADDSLFQSGSQRADFTLLFCMHVLYIFTHLLKVNNYYDLNFCQAQRVKPEFNPINTRKKEWQFNLKNTSPTYGEESM